MYAHYTEQHYVCTYMYIYIYVQHMGDVQLHNIICIIIHYTEQHYVCMYSTNWKKQCIKSTIKKANNIRDI